MVQSPRRHNRGNLTKPKGFAYQAAIPDGYSGKGIGRKLLKGIDTKLALEALEMALANRQIKPGLTHPGEPGVQYTSGAKVSRLQEAGIAISLSPRGNPYDNARADSFMMKTFFIGGGTNSLLVALEAAPGCTSFQPTLSVTRFPEMIISKPAKSPASILTSLQGIKREPQTGKPALSENLDNLFRKVG